MRIGFLGLGRMGRGMASRLLERGHELIVWNRSPGPAQALAARGAHAASDAEETLQADVIITMLGDDAAVEAVWLAPALLQRMPSSALHLNMATVSLSLAQRLAASHGASGTSYVSAPVFGRPEAAAKGELDIVASGPPGAVQRCASLFESLARQWFDLGEDATHATVVKIARNFLLGTVIESLGEAFALAGKSGIAPARFLEIITATSMNAPVYKNYGRLMLENPREPTFTLKLGMKDIELALQAGAQTCVPMPMAALIREQHIAAMNRGYADRDWAALGNYIAEAAGLGNPK